MVHTVFEFVFTHKWVMVAIVLLAFWGLASGLIRAIIGARESSKQAAELERIRSITRRIVPHAWR